MPETGKKNKETGFVERVWSFFTSLKLLIVLLLILAGISIAGTVIEQNKPLHEYYRFFSPQTVDLFDKLGLLDMYHSWWFLLCLALLALNLIACTLSRYEGILAGMRKKNLLLDDRISKSLNPLEKIRYNLPYEKVEQEVVSLVAREFSAKPVVTAAEDGSRHYFFEKGRYSRLAFFFTHLSVLVIFLGGIIGAFFGFKGYLNLFEGESTSHLPLRSGRSITLDFNVKCLSFNVDFYPNGMPKDYRSDLVIIKNGREVLRKTIRVNDPLTFQGVSFYQSSYGSLPAHVTLAVLDREGRLKESLNVPFGGKIQLTGVKEALEIADYQERIRLPSGLEAGPAIGVNIYPEKGEPFGIWLLADNPDYDRMRGGAYYLRVQDIKLRKYTGLQVNKDPGEFLVWLGSVCLIVGIMAAFFLSHKRLWLRLERDRKGRVELTIGGTANKNRASFEKEVGNLIQRLKEVS